MQLQAVDPAPEPDPEGWQLCTKRKPTAWHRPAPSLADLATGANGFGAMPCTEKAAMATVPVSSVTPCTPARTHIKE
eukprot:scaffold53175_cov16-Tisochrysis_lutea.AAC.1